MMLCFVQFQQKFSKFPASITEEVHSEAHTGQDYQSDPITSDISATIALFNIG